MRHAFLIAAHHQFDILSKTLQILDDDDVDFYIHIDKKSKVFPDEELRLLCRKSKVYFTDRMSVNWGGYSQIQCTLLLLKSSIGGKYDYYHYISGVDLPIKKKEEILQFFREHPDKQFIHFERENVQEKYVDRLKYHSFFQDSGTKMLKIMDKGIRRVERLLHVDRTRKNPGIEFQYGTNWFSITHDFARFVLEHEKWIKKTFSYTRCGDELLIQTLIVNSPFVKQLTDIAFDDNYMSVLRFIDWKRGKPYIFRKENYDELIKSPYLLARKFDLNIDSEIVDAVYHYCMS